MIHMETYWCDLPTFSKGEKLNEESLYSVSFRCLGEGWSACLLLKGSAGQVFASLQVNTELETGGEKQVQCFQPKNQYILIALPTSLVLIQS